MSSSRTTISLDKELFDKGQKRAKALGYRGGFSEYVAFLIDRDVTERPKHVVVREESEPYGKQTAIEREIGVEAPHSKATGAKKKSVKK